MTGPDYKTIRKIAEREHKQREKRRRKGEDIREPERDEDTHT